MADEHRDLGPTTAADTPYYDAPYGLVTRFQHEHADEFWMYTSEHTDLMALDAMWQTMPDSIEHTESLSCRHAPEFKDLASTVTVHCFIARKEGDPIAGKETKVILSAQILG